MLSAGSEAQISPIDASADLQILAFPFGQFQLLAYRGRFKAITFKVMSALFLRVRRIASRAMLAAVATPPAASRAYTFIFCDFGILRPRTNGMGCAKIATSVMTLATVSARYIPYLLKHFPGVIGSQNFDIGEQMNILKNCIET